MKRLFYLFVVAAVAAACSSEPHYSVTGTINGADSGMVILQKRISGGYSAIDSAIIENGTFKMKGSVEYPQMVSLVIENRRRGLDFFIENSEILVTGHADSLYLGSVTGSVTQSEYEAYLASFDELNKEAENIYRSYREARMAGDEELTASLESQLEDFQDKEIGMKKEFIANNTKSFVTPSVLYEISYYLEADELDKYLGGFDTTLNKVTTVITLKERLERMKAVQVGQKAPDFTLNDVNGLPVSLYSKIGGNTRLLLIDFWASWCGPCRMENPNVVKVWNDYNKKGFDVFGVSLDQSAEAWKKGIEDDKLTWTHVSDLKFWACEPAKLYAVSAIPSNFLVDGNGIIVGHNLRGADLAAKVSEILDAK